MEFLFFGIYRSNFQSGNWSGRRGSNPRPSPWQGDALSAELLPRTMRTDPEKEAKLADRLENCQTLFTHQATC